MPHLRFHLGLMLDLLIGLLSHLVFWLLVILFRPSKFHHLLQDQCLAAPCPHSLGLDICRHKNHLYSTLLQSKWTHRTISIFAMQFKSVHAIFLGKSFNHLNHCGSHRDHSERTPFVSKLYRQWPPCWLWTGCRYIQSNVCDTCVFLGLGSS